MFTPRNSSLRAGQSPFTATSQGNKSAQTRRVASVFTPTKKQKSLQSRSVLQASQLLEETSNFRIEKFGLPLPVLITEALTFADKSTRISVKVDESGWAWLVGGRKLFVWRCKQGQTGRNILCKELTLPPSDLAHSAARVCVIPCSGDSQSASCIAVSPEGVVRYWSNIAYEASSMEISAELKGEECDCVVNLYPFGCLLATTTSSLVMIAAISGQNSISCHPLKATQGMFAGIGRRMSSLIFGGGQGQTIGTPLQAVIAGVHEEDERPFYVLSGTYMNKWVIGDYNMEKFMYQIDADRLFREALARKIWDKDAIQMTQLTTWMLDMHLTRDGIVVLGAGFDTEMEPVVHYALATIATECSGTPSRLEAFRVLQFTKRYQEDNEVDLLGYRFLVPENSQDSVYLYNDYTIIMDNGTGEPSEELPAPGGRLLGAGNCEGTAVFFSAAQGLISITSNLKQNVSILDEATQELVSRSDVTQLATSTAQIEELSMSDDKSARLKAAFLSACSGNLKQAQDIVDELFPKDAVSTGNQTTDIDRLVSGLSCDLIDDYPASDPRWAENVKSDSGSGMSSLIILQQLKDKQRAHEYIINFLKKVNLWDKLRTIKIGSHVMSTRLLLCQHAEQLEAAIILREMHSDYSAVIDPAIRKVLTARGEPMGSGLSPQDLFYREVSHIHDIFEALLEYENDIMCGNFAPSDIITVIASVNPIMEGMLHAAVLYRQTKAVMYETGTELTHTLEFTPWTSTAGSSGVRTLIHKQFMLTLESAVPEARDTETRGQLFQQLLSLADNILDGYTSQLTSLAHKAEFAEYTVQVEEQYKQERHHLISPFLEYEQYEQAGSLAEKYCDFEMLIRICEDTENQERIQRYQQQFADKGFSDFLFAWYMKEGKQGRLLSLPTQQQKQLNSFLQKDEFGYLKWLHDIECKDFQSAHETLLNLGRNEEQYLAKKKTMLSLAKLAALACGDVEEQMKTDIRDIDEEQELVLNQELLPVELLETMNVDAEHMKVLTPVELIQLYICEENTAATEYDFKKAHDLMQFLDTEDPAIDYETVRNSIWCKAILRDKAIWTHTPTGDPVDSVRDTIFFKTVSLAVTDGWDPRSLLPDLQSLLTCEVLAAVATNKQLQFLLAAVYELVNNYT
ncbi:nuclear pore complex protein Nup133-like [Mercenaria mercenaria]|uniref:nuclear pore complex protein Nup133-like n=1 Tax=Mercenaria mercenaria TaxID=6596 RepID=UPI00234F986A|nr:nuclear pore complex protein Nup133-like [Mercenaria mercenaria]